MFLNLHCDLCFRPLYPPLENKMYLIWKKYQVFTPISDKFLQLIKEELSKEQERQYS